MFPSYLIQICDLSLSLGEGHTVTYMLRKPSVFDKDAKMQKYIQEGRAKIISGDATIRTDVQKALTEARIDGQLDSVLFTVGECD